MPLIKTGKSRLIWFAEGVTTTSTPAPQDAGRGLADTASAVNMAGVPVIFLTTVKVAGESYPSLVAAVPSKLEPTAGVHRLTVSLLKPLIFVILQTSAIASTNVTVLAQDLGSIKTAPVTKGLSPK